MSDTQRLIIRFEHSEGYEEVIYERREGPRGNDPVFWDWFKNAWRALGLNFIAEELEHDQR